MKRDKHLDELEARKNKTLPPGSRHDQYWCAILKGGRCDCDDDPPPAPRRRRGTSSGGAKPPARALEDACAMNRYLQKLHSLEHAAKPPNVKTGDPYPPSKLSKPPFEGFEGDRGCARSRILKPSALVLAMLQEHCPDHVERGRWQHAVEDGHRCLAKWGMQAAALGWTPRDLLGLQKSPDQPHPSYRRLSRYDETGLIWLLQGRPVVALTAATAAIENPPGPIPAYPRYANPHLGPVGDSLDDFQ